MNFQRIPRLASATLLLVSLGAATACKKAEPPPAPAPAPVAPAAISVADISLGKSVNADKTVTATATTFAPTDTIYAAVKTTGSAASVTLGAKWTYDNSQSVHEESLPLAPSGPTVTDFQISRPSGWPAGKYKVEISIDGATAGSREFEVK